MLCHCGLAIYIKTYLKAKEELWKLKYFTIQKYNLQKILYKKPKSFKVLQLYDYSQVSTQTKNTIFQKSSDKNKPIKYEPKSLKLLYSIMKLNTISLPTKAKATKGKKVMGCSLQPNSQLEHQNSHEG